MLTANRRNAIQGNSDLKARASAVLKRINDVWLDLPIFLNTLTWGCDAVAGDSATRYQRSLLMNSVELPQIIGGWERRSKPVRPVLVTRAVGLVNRLIIPESEMEIHIESGLSATLPLRSSNTQFAGSKVENLGWLTRSEALPGPQAWPDSCVRWFYHFLP